MADFGEYERRRSSLHRRFLDGAQARSPATVGVDHIVLVSRDLEATIDFYAEILGMPLVRIAANRDDPTSTHIFFDMGGGNQLAFFDFPEAVLAPARPGLGSLQHLAVRVAPEHLRTVLERLRQRGLLYDLHGTEVAGAAYVRDPDGVLIEITTGYRDSAAGA